MYTRTATIAASVGLHARPAAVFVRAVNQTGLPVTLRKAGLPPVDGRSLLAVMSADFGFGAEVELALAEGAVDDAVSRSALDDLAALLRTTLSDSL